MSKMDAEDAKDAEGVELADVEPVRSSKRSTFNGKQTELVINMAGALMMRPVKLTLKIL